MEIEPHFYPSGRGWRGIVVLTRAGSCQTLQNAFLWNCRTDFQSSIKNCLDLKLCNIMAYLPHMGLPMGQKLRYHWGPDFVEHISPKPLDGFTPFEVLRNCLNLQLCNIIGALNFDLSHDLNLEFSRSNFEKAVFQEWQGRLTWNKGMWVDKMLDPLYDLQLWSWPWIFKVKCWKSHITGMRRPIDIEWKGCESIKTGTQFVALNFYLVHDSDLGF